MSLEVSKLVPIASLKGIDLTLKCESYDRLLLSDVQNCTVPERRRLSVVMNAINLFWNNEIEI